MGLAASQARLLFLTARKDDVEYAMMRISNEKISLSRDTTELSEKYSRELNQRKLQFALGDSGGTTVDLNYDAIMKPNSLGLYNQYVLTDTSGRVVLDDKYATIVNGLGISQSGGTDPSVAVQESFLTKMGLDATKVPAYVSAYNTGDVEPDYKFKVGDYDLATLDKYMSDTKMDADANGEGGKSWLTAYNANEVFSLCGQDGDITGSLEKFINKMSKDIGTAFKSYLKESDSDFSKILSSVIQPAIDNAASKTYDKFTDYGKEPTKIYDPEKNGYTYKPFAQKVNQVTSRTNLWYTPVDSGVGVKQIVDTFLSYLDAELSKYSEGLTGDKSSDPLNNIRDKSTSRTVRGTGDKTDFDYKENESSSEAEFYLNLLDEICNSGWTQRNAVATSPEYLEDGVRNGNLLLKEFKSKGDWDKLSLSDPDSLLRDVRDKEGIAAAEVEYEMNKSKLETKEEELDLKLKNLDTERSALDTEVDSVKSIINKNIERSFKLFQTG